MRAPSLRQIRNLTFARAGLQCEATYPTAGPSRYRCRNRAEELHHVLPRSRGGGSLDFVAWESLKAGEFDVVRHLSHLLALCSVCHHEVAHGQPERAREARMTVPGFVVLDLGVPVYTGPDGVLAALWPQEDAA